MHNVNWKKVCSPVEHGGLAVRGIEINNLALLAKMAWRVFANPNSEISGLLRAKYFPNREFWNCEVKSKSSVSWKSILKGRDAVKSCLR